MPLRRPWVSDGIALELQELAALGAAGAPPAACSMRFHVETPLCTTAGLPSAKGSGEVASTAEVSKLAARVAELEKLAERQAYRIKILSNSVERGYGSAAGGGGH